MHVPSFIAALAATPLFVSAAPARFYGKRAAAASDVTVLQFANVLEQLETEFYTQGIAKFQSSDFTAAGFKNSDVPLQQLQDILKDEATHTKVLQDTLKSLGQTPITSCKFKFDSALTDVATMAATARVVENVGVAAYAGAARLVEDRELLTAAATIMTVEARHQTIMNILSRTGTPVPSAFDIALNPNEVLAIAAPFIDGPCDLGVAPNPTLAITNQGAVQPGTLLTFSSDALNGPTDGKFCQMMIGGSPFSISLPLDQCVVPSGINGPVAIWITSDGQALLNDVVNRAAKGVVAGPTMAFIDTIPEALSEVAVSGSDGLANNAGSSNPPSNDGSTSTTISTSTISPAEASSIIASAANPTQTGSAGAAAPAVVAGPVSSVTVSADSAAATDGAAPPSPSGNAASSNPAVNVTPGQPNMFMGKSSDGSLTVLGWSETPAQ
ncbi:hypothetical protein AGABI2DRAFT_177560 [Agaricus bisporus var. bisporus H97]|uniref:hypothetical protein n=1 Tax=Agaricus bisporus var. bisporus (strain H97 / ATCC MYA-4626 / FGSC 10389) TaxID=936046 RepID=UPI00029F51BE|nr:hypothetical protein AGABI2DRAFT_177560 [Agaricus bisporus var. bisporus H97]EKV47867.1 hypothetical protein AGABI2DRAFT_177560 [Agaricus bisporus var. bisporus H97]